MSGMFVTRRSIINICPHEKSLTGFEEPIRPRGFIMGFVDIKGEDAFFSVFVLAFLSLQVPDVEKS